MGMSFVGSRSPNAIDSCNSICNSGPTELQEPVCWKRSARNGYGRKENKPQFDLRADLFRMTDTDLTRIDGIAVQRRQAIHSLT